MNNLLQMFRGLTNLFRIPPQQPRIEAETRRQALDSLPSPSLVEIDPNVARLVLDQVKDVAEKTQAANRTIEGKATTFIGVAAALIGLSLAENRLVLEVLRWPIMLSDALFFVSIIFGVFANAPRETALPSAIVYNLPRTLKVENEGVIASALSESWYEYARDVAVQQGHKALAARYQFACFLIGIILLTVSASYAIATGSGGGAIAPLAKGGSSPAPLASSFPPSMTVPASSRGATAVPTSPVRSSATPLLPPDRQVQE